ncbi:NADH-quinone oxidoreductase subunit NuoK [Fimbriiglobus ruber]|uniref:NADH-quinone oxidoreductase subunit K n=1 Tax=Fimbriiglobus ruber TaxID=1908690 RepID=A0A225DZW2_9BACT|nr:NADH-quinone oxidoreductase subunit NuoK [Fimbriiglobus ruber]OWK41657.1 NADH-ubiquinone oxidoreductase chain K [Fimbriiglobus ruber]
MISLWHYLAVGAVLFGIGLVGFLSRRNLITMFLCSEMMLQGVVLNLLAFGRYHGTINGQVFALFVITVAACEAGLALALFLTMYRRGKTLDSGAWQSLREEGLSATVDTEPLPVEPKPLDDPKLPTAGRKPAATEEPVRV